MKYTTSPPSLQRWINRQNRRPAPSMTKGRTALANARDHSRRRICRTVRISAQIPKHAQIPSKTGIPMITKAKSVAMGVELRATKSSGNPSETHTGQSLFTDDTCAASMLPPLHRAETAKPTRVPPLKLPRLLPRSEEHTSELQS